MSIELRLDLAQATVADLHAFLAAAESAGAANTTAVTLEGSVMSLNAAPNAQTVQKVTSTQEERNTSSDTVSSLKPLGDQAFNHLLDALVARAKER